MAYSNYDIFLSENVNLEDVKNKRILAQLEEANKVEISDKLISELYKLSLKKGAEIDYGEIPDSKGDITRLPNYKTLVESINLLNKIVPQPNDKLDIINATHNLIKSYTKEFCLSFIQNKEMGIVLYNNMVLSLITSVSFLLCVSVDYLRTPDSTMGQAENNKIKYDKKDLVIFDSMCKMIDAANKGDIKKLFNNILSKDNFVGISITAGTSITIAGIVLAVAIAIVPVTRMMIYAFYDLRMKVSEYFRIQAQFLELNSENLASNPNIKDKSKIIKKQKEQIKKLNNLANKIEVKFNTDNAKTTKELNKKVDYDKFKDSLGDDITLI